VRGVSIFVCIITGGLAGCGSVTPGKPGDAGLPGDTGSPDASTAFAVVKDLKGTFGYTDASGKATALVFFNAGRDATCKVGHDPEVNGMAFVPCPTPAADGTVTLPVIATANATDGTYHAYVNAKDAAGHDVTYDTGFYMHRTIDGAATCPIAPAHRPTDTEFFTEALKQFSAPMLTRPPAWMTGNSGILPHATPFEITGTTRLDPPFYNLHFTNVTLGTERTLPTVDANRNVGRVGLPGPRGTMASFDLPMWSLRHHLALNADKTLAILYRSYESRSAHDYRNGQHLCAMPTQFGTNIGRPPTFQCEAYVFNAAGEGFCMTVDGSGAPHQAVFSEQLVQKLMPKAVGEDVAEAGHGSVWGPKIFSPTSATFPDNLTFRPDLTGKVPHRHSRAAILRP
jgi:hypothetical protein